MTAKAKATATTTATALIQTIDNDKIKWLMTIYERSDRHLTISSTHFLVVLRCAVLLPRLFWLCLLFGYEYETTIRWSYSYEYQMSVIVSAREHGVESGLDLLVRHFPIKLLRLDCFGICLVPLPYIISGYCGLAFVFNVQCALCVHSYNKFILFYVFMTTMKRKTICLFHFFLAPFGFTLEFIKISCARPNIDYGVLSQSVAAFGCLFRSLRLTTLQLHLFGFFFCSSFFSLFIFFVSHGNMTLISFSLVFIQLLRLFWNLPKTNFNIHKVFFAVCFALNVRCI